MEDTTNNRGNCFGCLVTTIDVSENSEAKRQVLHDLGDKLDHEQHSRDQDENSGHFRSSKVLKVTEQAVSFDSLVLDVANRDKSHSQVEAEISSRSVSEEQREDVVNKNNFGDLGFLSIQSKLV